MHNQLFHSHQFVIRDFKYQFIMYLHQQSAQKTFPLDPPVYPDHSLLDYICRRPLNRVIDGISFSKGTDREVAAADISDWKPSPQNSRDKSFLSGMPDTTLEKADRTGMSCLVAIDEILCDLARDPQLLCQAERALTVYHTEINRFRLTPHLRRHHLGEKAKDLTGGTYMDIFVPFERITRDSVLRKMSKHPEFYLRIIGRDELVTLLRDKSPPDYPPFICPDRDVLQVRIG